MPTYCDVPFGWRFLRHERYAPVAMSYSTPSGLTMKTIQVSRLSTTFLMRASVAYLDVSSRRV